MISGGSFKDIKKGSTIFGVITIISILTYAILCMFLPVATPKGNTIVPVSTPKGNIAVTISNTVNDTVDTTENKQVVFKYDSMKKCVGSNCYQFGLGLLLSIIGFLAFYIFERVFPKWGFVVIVILSIASIATISTINKLDTEFEYVKFVSIILATLLLAFTRIANITNFKQNFISKDIWSWVLWVVLAANIGEAVVTEFKSGHYVNPIVGILLILFMPNPLLNGVKWKELLFVDKGNFRDLVYKTPMAWVIMYILWNANYAYSDRKEHFSDIIVVLVTTLLGSLPSSLAVNPFLFVQIRTFTLFLRYMVIGFDDVFEKYSDSTGWYNEKAKEIWGYVNLVLSLLIIMYYGVNKIPRKHLIKTF